MFKAAQQPQRKGSGGSWRAELLLTQRMLKEIIYYLSLSMKRRMDLLYVIVQKVHIQKLLK